MDGTPDCFSLSGRGHPGRRVVRGNRFGSNLDLADHSDSSAHCPAAFTFSGPGPFLRGWDDIRLFQIAVDVPPSAVRRPITAGYIHNPPTFGNKQNPVRTLFREYAIKLGPLPFRNFWVARATAAESHYKVRVIRPW